MSETKAPAARPYRSPADRRAFLDRAGRDWELLCSVEKVLARPPDIMAAMVRCEPEKYARFMGSLVALVDRHVVIVDAATDAYLAIHAALKG